MSTNFEQTAPLSSQRLLFCPLHLPPIPYPKTFTSPSWAVTELLLCTGLASDPKSIPSNPNRYSVQGSLVLSHFLYVGFSASHPKAPVSGCQPTLSWAPCLLSLLYLHPTTHQTNSPAVSGPTLPLLGLHVSACTQVHSLECSSAISCPLNPNQAPTLRSVTVLGSSVSPAGSRAPRWWPGCLLRFLWH